jgi:hypothetical protein
MYSVAILPDATAEETAAFRLTAVVANTPELQAARFADGTVAAIFHAPGTLDGFTTDSPGIFLLHENMVFVADPTQQLKTMTVTYRDVVRCIDLPDDDLAGTTTVLVF